MTDATMSLTLHDLSPEQVTAILAIVTGEAPAAEEKPKPAPRKRTTKPKKEEPAEEPAEDTSGDSDEGGTPTREDVVAALKAYRDKHSKEAAEAIIHGPGGSKNLSGISEENFAAVIEACSKEPAAEDDWD